MPDYLVYKERGELKLTSNNQFKEEDHLIGGLVPGVHFVVISEVITEKQALEGAEAYFNGTYPDRDRIDCWVAGALERQRCLKEKGFRPSASNP